jgi:hypothetical protein
VIWLKDVNGQAWRMDLTDSKLEQIDQGQRLLTSEPR